MSWFLPGVVDAVVVCSDRFAARVRALALDVPVVRLRLPVDADRFAGNGRLPARPRRALIVSNYLHGERRRALVDAWEAQGVTCTQVGVLGEPVLDPSVAMRDADIVVGKAGAALEGMACGRAVYVYDQFGGDGWVTPETYPAFEADNMAGLSSATPRSLAQLAADLVDYDPDMGWINEELIRTHHTSRRHAQELVGVLRADHASPPAATSVLAEITRLTRVAWGATQRSLSVEHELVALRERVLEAESQVAAREHVARESEQHLERAENAERELAAWTARAHNAERELAAWTVRAQNAERELAAWTARAQRAEAGAAGAQSELAARRERALEAERQLAEAQRRLATARVRAGLAAGRVVDRLRRRR